MIYIKLLLTFFKIGLFSFGGGSAMIPMFEREIIEANGWIDSKEFVDIIAISEMTPGPIAVNSATYVGYKAAGLFGGLFATVGVILPSLILILIISHFFFKFKEHPKVKSIFNGIRPVIAGLIFGAAVFVAKTSIFNGELSSLLSSKFNPLQYINWTSLLIFGATFFCLWKYKWHPILVIALSGTVGVILFYLGLVN